MSLTETPKLNTARKEFYDKIDGQSLAPLWAVMSALVTPEPRSRCQAHMWRFADLRDFLIESGDLITAKEAERRVLILENPGMRGNSSVTTSLYAGLQLVTPGECAPAHRHSQSALRLVLETSAGAHTTVNGERTPMHFGDFIITPPWGWHDHGNDGDAPAIWLDGLDVPIVSLFDTSFAEEYGEDQQPLTRKSGDSLARYANNLLPVGYESGGKASPIFNYPYQKARESLDALLAQGEIDPWHGIKMQYINPIDGGSAMPTMSTFIQMLPKGLQTQPYQSTDATVFVALEGSGVTRIDGQDFAWGPRDIVVVPSWKPVQHRADDDAVLFSFSDRVAQEKLGLFREKRGNI